MAERRLNAEIVEAWMRRSLDAPLELTAEQWDYLRRMYPPTSDGYGYGGQLGAYGGVPVVVKPPKRRWWHRLLWWQKEAR